MRRSGTGAVDALFSESATSPAMPTNYDQKRRIGAVLTNGGANIVRFTQIGNRFCWNNPVSDYGPAASASTSAQLHTLTVPIGLKIRPLHVHSLNRLTIAESYSLVTDPDQTDTAPSASAFTSACQGDQQHDANNILCHTNTLAQVRSRQTHVGSTDIDGVTFGWVDPRGSNA